MLTVIIVIVLAVAGYFLYKKLKPSTTTEESLVKETLKNIDAKPSVPEELAAKIAVGEVLASLKSPELKPEVEPSVEEESYEITEEEFQAEVAAGSTEVTTEEVKDAKPVRKKKRRYYTKK